MVFNKNLPQIVCNDLDWVKCHLSECAVVPSILSSARDIKCHFYNIIHKTDRDYYVDSISTMITGDEVFTLKNSDNVKVRCTGRALANDRLLKWIGVVSGLRSKVKSLGSPPGRENTINVLMFGYDSTSRNGFIRKMPESYEYLKNDLEATFLTGYNIIGDGTTWALHALLTGRNELDLPEARKRFVKTFLNNSDFIFHKLRKDGYRTAYYEDSPNMGTFQLRFQGFAEQPADHYLRDFYFELSKLSTDKQNEFCVGDTPSYTFLMNITQQFFTQDGKKFCFTKVGDMCHYDFNLLASADKDFVKFLRWFKETGRLQNTLLMIFGDHGVRRTDVRATYQGKMEERLPLMAIVLPEQLIKSRPEIKSALKANADILTTPYDIYNTVLDAVDMTDHWITYKVKGADLPRGLTLFRPIPSTRSCSEAAIENRWCTCHTWQTIHSSNKRYHLAAAALVDHINDVTKSIR
ncbi:uncharacterized protein LOC113228748 [Hyposmocoma kahamanoa]|uniref:uncharacterized protein LOC113228748 n=1 Tax=Hyposmocoma kahamanoa TaxID=1477025 RepID=UPI000E6D9EBE|nr:uncharacterized protein LOC113228748 [Hyposmocoma kahamanoa]